MTVATHIADRFSGSIASSFMPSVKGILGLRRYAGEGGRVKSSGGASVGS